MSIRAIVRTYIKNYRPKTLEELNWYREQPDIKSTVELAALAINRKGQRQYHQRRLSRGPLEEARKILMSNLEEIIGSKDFDQLITLFEALLKPIHGIGELYIYDTALRIGAKLDLLPEKVYLHAGTREGAKALGIPGKTKEVEPSRFPTEFQELKPYEIEDVLCIYEEILKKEKLRI